MKGAQRKVCLPFRVYTEKHLSNNTVFAVIGSIPKLGLWNPHKCVALERLSKTTSGEVWGKDITITPTEREISFRYFIAEILDFNDEDDSRLVKVIQWETFYTPRCIDITDILLNEEVQTDTFGTYNGDTRLQRGWLTGQKEVHLRFYGDAFKWFKPRHRGRRLYVRCSQVSLKKDQAGESCEYEPVPDVVGGMDEDDTCDSCCQPHLRSAASFSVLRPGLCGPRMAEHGRHLGAAEVRAGDYVTFQFQTLDLEALSVELEMFVGSRLAEPEDAGEPRPVGTVRMMPFEQTAGVKWLHIFGNHRRVIGQMKVDFLIIGPLHGPTQLMERSFSKHWRKRSPLKVGHRGTGTSYASHHESSQKMSAVKENTLRSLRTAFEHGADYVEFDVHLSKDKVPVVYHDFKVVLTLKKKRREDHRYMEVAVKDLTLEELQGLKVSHTGVLSAGHSNDEMTEEESDALETLAFCTLRQVFEHFDANDTAHGFNIEVKFPMPLSSGEHEQENYFERNDSVDAILREVFHSAGRRRVVFSSFDPDVCTMLVVKQNKYPVLFLTQGASPKYEQYVDPRTQSLMLSVCHAVDVGLLGLCGLSSEVISDTEAMALAHKHGLILFAWGSDIEDETEQTTLKTIPVDAIIFDRIHEQYQHGTANTFRAIMEREAEPPSEPWLPLLSEGMADGELSPPGHHSGSVTSSTVSAPSGAAEAILDVEMEPLPKRAREND